jgi:signal transduction histidine kinase
MNVDSHDIGVVVVTAAIAVLISWIALGRRHISRFTSEEIETIASIMKRLLHLMGVTSDEEYLHSALSIWINNLASRQEYVIVNTGEDENDIYLEHGNLTDPTAWGKRALALLQEDNFIWLPKKDRLLRGVRVPGCALLFKLETEHISKVLLVLFPHLPREKRRAVSTLFNNLYAMVTSARTQALAAEHISSMADIFQAKYLNVWKVLSTLDHNLRGTVSSTFALLEVLQGYSDDGNDEEVLKILKNDVLPLVATGKGVVSTLESTMRGILEGDVIGRVNVMNLAEVFETNFGTWLSRMNATMSKPVEISWEISADLTIKATKDAFFQIVWNVLRNAIRYTRAGTIKISAHEGIDGHIYLAIADTGPGIEPEDLDNIGQYEFRGSTTKSVKGKGVGLWGAYSFMKLLGGNIDIKTQVGEGTTFLLGFPKG